MKSLLFFIIAPIKQESSLNNSLLKQYSVLKRAAPSLLVHEGLKQLVEILFAVLTETVGRIKVGGEYFKTITT
jgi:hypothetical protein